MKCFQCKKEIKNVLYMIVTAPDGDCFCNQICHEQFKKDRDHFLNVIIHDDTLYEQWLYSDIGVSRGELGI